MIPNFSINTFLSEEFKVELSHLSITDFHQLCTYVQKLPVERISDSNNFVNVLLEKRGNCTSKHGLLAEVLDMHNERESVHLMLGIFMISEKNFPELKPILDKYNLTIIPDTHVYFRVENDRIDFTYDSNYLPSRIESFLIREQRCDANQLIEWKFAIYKDYVQRWLKRQNSSVSLDDVFECREECLQYIQRFILSKG